MSLFFCNVATIKAISSCFCLFLHAECGRWVFETPFSPLLERGRLVNGQRLGMLLERTRGEKYTTGLHMVILFISARSAPIPRPGQSPSGRVTRRTAVSALALKSPPGRKRVGWDLYFIQAWRMLNSCLPGKWSHISCRGVCWGWWEKRALYQTEIRVKKRTFCETAKLPYDPVHF